MNLCIYISTDCDEYMYISTKCDSSIPMITGSADAPIHGKINEYYDKRFKVTKTGVTTILGHGDDLKQQCFISWKVNQVRQDKQIAVSAGK